MIETEREREIERVRMRKRGEEGKRETGKREA